MSSLNSGPSALASAMTRLTSFFLSLFFIASALASVIGKDDREVISHNRDQIDFTDAEVAQAMHCLGRLYCPGAVVETGGHGGMMSAGAVCPVGVRTPEKPNCPADRIATAAHGFFDKRTGKRHPKVEQCEFRNYAGFTTKLVASDVSSVRPAYEVGGRSSRADKIVVRLIKRLPKCDPYDIALGNDLPVEGQRVIALTHPQVDMPNNPQSRFYGHEPLAYPCTIRKIYRARQGQAGVFYSDCDVNGLGSGGFALARREKEGPLQVLGLFTSAGKPENNGEPYDESKMNVTVSVMVDGDFPQILAHPGMWPKLAAAPEAESPSEPLRRYAIFSRPSAKLREWVTPDGLRLLSIDEEVRTKFKLERNVVGVVVSEVPPGSGRDEGWRVGDVIVAVDDGDESSQYRAVGSSGEIKAALDHAAVVGRFYVAAEVMRGTKSMQLNLYVER